MSVIVLKRRFEAPPSKDEILNLLVGDNVGDKGKAKEALGNILAPMKDLLAFYQFMDNLDSAAGKYADMLKEHEVLTAEVAGVKAGLVVAKKGYEEITAVQKENLAKIIADVSAKAGEVSELETRKADLIQEIEDEEKGKLRINKAISAEYDRAREVMLVNLADEEKVIGKKLAAIEAKVKAAQDELDALAEKKRQFIASLR